MSPPSPKVHSQPPLEELIQTHLDDAGYLEELYRRHKTAFRHAVANLSSAIDHPALRFWLARLSWQDRHQPPKLGIAALLALGAWVPLRFVDAWVPDPERWIPALGVAVLWPSLGYLLGTFKGWRLTAALGIGVGLGLYVFWLTPAQSDSVIMALLHLPILACLLWLGMDRWHDLRVRVDFFVLLNEAAVWTAALLFFGAILTVLVLGLFALFDFNVMDFLLQNVVSFGFLSAPYFGLVLAQSRKDLGLSHHLSRIFVFPAAFMLLLYLGLSLATGFHILEHQEHLIAFFLAMVGALGLIFAASGGRNQGGALILWGLRALAAGGFLTGLVTVGSLLWRSVTQGLTPNRLVFLGDALLLGTQLGGILYALLRPPPQGEELAPAAKVVVTFLPLDAAWLATVVFLLPAAWGWG